MTNEISIVANGRTYLLNNNSDKYKRAIHAAGKHASPDEVLAHYDHLGGLILNERREKVENGVFWDAYARWKEDVPKYVKIIEDRVKTIDEGEQNAINLGIKNVDHKRAFLGTLMTIATAITAGLFLFFSGEVSANKFVYNLAVISGVGMAAFVCAAAVYLTVLLSQESTHLSGRLKFVRKSKADFVDKLGTEIHDIDSFNKFREKMYAEEVAVGKKIPSSWEGWFILICSLFIISAIPLLIMFARLLCSPN